MVAVSRSPETFTYPSAEVTGCPYAFYQALREQAPAYRLPNGDFIVSRWEDIVHVVRYHRSARRWRDHHAAAHSE